MKILSTDLGNLYLHLTDDHIFNGGVIVKLTTKELEFLNLIGFNENFYEERDEILISKEQANKIIIFNRINKLKKI